jgi:Do/DeqQ family serine protease
MKLKQIFLTVVISAVTALGIIWGYSKFVKNANSYGGQIAGTIPSNYKYAGFSDNGTTPPGAIDFTQPAAAAIPTVVHIKTKTNAKQLSNNLPRSQSRNPFSDFFGEGSNDMINQLFGGGRMNIIPEQRASGSGVIISDDGYIVTNNHVVANADEITVTLSNKKVYKAKVIGTDASYDLAVIKIDAAALPYLIYGNSDEAKVGQWVLAIGYPLNLETTVTAGIISAKARTLGLNRNKAGDGVESYLQTDAAVNMGNSGGALINTDGKLIGINSAIASPTGYYSGYSYAIPVNIVKKVVDDIIKYGTVQRGYLGINYLPASDMSDDDKKKEGIPETAFGIYVRDVPTNGGAYAAGIRKGDVIKSIGGVDVTSGAEVQAQVSLYKPGDKVPVVYARSGKENTTTVILKNNVGTLDPVKNDAPTASAILGAELSDLDAKKAKDFGVPGGVIVKKISEDGILDQQTRMRDSFIILKINDKNVSNISELNNAIGSNKDFTVSGFYPGYEGMYDYQLSLGDN